MARARDEVEPFAAILGRRLQAVLTPDQSTTAERKLPADSQPERAAISEIDLSPDTTASAPPPIPEPEAPPATDRPFERLRAMTEAAAASGARFWGGVADVSSTAALPLDFSKTFVGVNATHYDECWRLMEWRGRYHSWNWAAALTLGGWMAYRRLYGCALLHSIWLGLLLLLALNGASLPVLATVQVAIAVMLGLYGNSLYRWSFRRAASTAALHKGDHAARLALLAESGGVDVKAVWIMGFAMAGLAALIVRFGKSLPDIAFAFPL